MSTDAEPPTPDNDDLTEWVSSSSFDCDHKEVISGIQNSFQKVVEGSTEAAGFAILLMTLLFLSARRDDDESMTPEEKAAEWDARTEPIQERFEAEEIDKSRIEDGITQVRSS